MNLRTTFILVVLAVLSTVLVEWLLKDRNLAIQWQAGQVLGRFRPSFFVAIEVQRPEGPIELVKKNGDWRCVSPDQFAASETQVLKFVEKILAIRSRDDIRDNVSKEERERFGIEQSQLGFVLTDSTGAKHEFLFGNEFSGTETIQFCYASYKARLFLCDLSVRDFIRDLRAETFRNRSLFRMNPREVLAVTLEGDREFSLEKGPVGWSIRHPVVEDAAEEEVTWFLGVLASWGIEQALDKAEIPPFEKRGRIKVELAGADVEVEFGQRWQSEFLLARRSDESEIFVVTAEGEPVLDLAVEDFVDRRVFREQVSAFKELRIRSGDLAIIDCQEFSLAFGSPRKAIPADKELLKQLIEALSSWRVNQVIPRTGDARAFGFDTPRLRLELSTLAGENRTALVGSSPDLGSDSEFYIFSQAWANFNGIGSVTADRLLLEAPYSLRSKSPFFVPFEVIKDIHLTTKAGSIRLVKPNRSWLIQGVDAISLEDDVKRCVAILAAIAVDKWEAYAKDGLDPIVTLDLAGFEGGVRAELGRIEIYRGQESTFLVDLRTGWRGRIKPFDELGFDVWSFIESLVRNAMR